MTSGEHKQRGPLFYALVCGVVLIWGYVAVQVVRGLKRPVEQTPEAVPPLDALPAKAEAMTGAVVFEYRPDFRDPFKMPRPSVGSEGTVAVKQTIVAKRLRPPPMSLHGVIGQTALLREDTTLTHLVQVGETVGGARILAIRSDHVVARFNGHTFTLSLVDPRK